jgi:hypothetical protein
VRKHAWKAGFDDLKGYHWRLRDSVFGWLHQGCLLPLQPWHFSLPLFEGLRMFRVDGADFGTASIA